LPVKPVLDVSVVIVHYETPLLLAHCLDSLGRSTGRLAVEAWVVDNASAGFMPEEWSSTYPTVNFLRNEANVGFAGASNRALRLARGRYLLLLNPDTEVAPDTLRTMTDYMEDHPDIGCATCRLELEDGSLDLACRRLFPTPMRSLYRISLLSRAFPRSRRFGQYNLTYLDDRSEAEIDTPCGAFMMVRAQVAEEVGLLDERYFMYGEDVDWAFRIKKAGWRIVYTPITTVKHLKRASSRKYRRQTIGYFHDGMRRFYRDHYASEYPWVVSAAVLFAISARERFELAAVAVRGAFGHGPR
jgi:N-acetylglucosaminyl-diphospho-decaprenol L-rhamnosyltransferase